LASSSTAGRAWSPENRGTVPRRTTPARGPYGEGGIGFEMALCLFLPDRVSAEVWDGPVLGVLQKGDKEGGKECVMPYCITLRSKTDARVTGWYAGRNCL
jgi:hypothetical protein